MRITVILVILLFLATPYLLAGIYLSDKQQKAVITQLKRSREIINESNERWHKLSQTMPIIEYEVKDGTLVIQRIEIPIYKADSLIYSNTLMIDYNKKELTWTPLTLNLCGILETTEKFDESLNSQIEVKIGFRFFSLSPTKIPVIQNINVNAMVGIRSSGFSLSYTLPKPFHNTAINLYGGFAYSGTMAYGLGISLNF